MPTWNTFLPVPQDVNYKVTIYPSTFTPTYDIQVEQKCVSTKTKYTQRSKKSYPKGTNNSNTN